MTDTTSPLAIIVDVDSTVALRGDRSPYDESRVHEDLPNLPVITVVRAMHNADHLVIFVSGRSEGCFVATRKWLTEHVDVPYAALHMRLIGDSRKDAVVKREMFDREIEGRFDVTAVFDDRRQCVDLWRSLGLACLAVADGDF